MKIKPTKLKGFQDYSGQIQAKRLAVMDAVRITSDNFGFNIIETPALEYAETLLGEGGETDKQVYMFEDNGGREVALRFDLTVPFARFAAENFGKYPLPFKRCQVGNVWRAEKPQKGRYREFCQCDFDIIGVDSKFADLETVTALANTLSYLKFGEFTVSFGHRNILGGLLRQLLPDLVKDPEGEQQALIAIDKLDKIGDVKVVELLKKLNGVDETKARELINLITVGAESSTLEKIKTILIDDAEAIKALDDTQFVIEGLNKFLENKSGRARLDLKIARGLAYYTGVVFETTLDALPNFGSICSGGRYNNLCDRFSKQKLPGVGGSIGLDRLVAGLMELESKIEKPVEQKRSGYYVTVATEEARNYAIEVCNELRSRGKLCDIDLKGQKLNKQFQTADKLNREFVIVIGDDELACASDRKVTLKDLGTGVQTMCTLDDL